MVPKTLHGIPLSIASLQSNFAEALSLNWLLVLKMVAPKPQIASSVG